MMTTTACRLFDIKPGEVFRFFKSPGLMVNADLTVVRQSGGKMLVVLADGSGNAKGSYVSGSRTVYRVA